MRLILFTFLTLAANVLSIAQSSSSIGVWLDHLPYGNIKDMVERSKVVYCATDQGLFVYDHEEQNIERYSKVNALSDVSLSCLGWSEQYRTLLIGYENGNIDLFANGNIENMLDIKASPSYSGLKQINHIETEGKYAYICTNFGIVQYDMDRGIVEETFVIGPNGITLAVTQLAFSEDSVFAATELGLFAANRNAPLLTFESWNPITSVGSSIPFVCAIDDRIFVYQSNDSIDDEILYSDGQGWSKSPLSQLYKGNLNDMRSDKGFLLVSNNFASYALQKDASTVFQNFQSGSQSFDVPSLTCSVISEDDRFFWVGTSGIGLMAWIKYDGVNSYSDQILPNSPNRKFVTQMYHDDERLFVSPGGYTSVWSPAFTDYGYYELREYDWTNHSSSEYNGYGDLVAFVTDPNDESRYYASSYGNGILEFKDGQFLKLINSQNSDMVPMANSTEQRIGGFTADDNGGIWFSNSQTERPLGVLREDGSIEMFSLGSLTSSSDAIKNIMYTSENQVWLQVRNGGVVVAQINEDGLVSDRKALASEEGFGNLPSGTVLSFAEDLDGEVWIGTIEGMAVLYSPQNIFEAERNYDFQIIVIDEDGDGNGERVLGTEVINDIEVDGSNKKWFATANSGVFYTSENGKEQIYNFTIDNSPLPSNNIMDIEVDDVTGMVYFATDQGIVSFQGGATEGVSSMMDVFAYPNPVEPGYDGPILIRGLVTNAQVKITDIEGNIVYETVAEGGQALWSGKSFSGERVKSGVYLAYITNDDGSAKAVTKIMIIN